MKIGYCRVSTVDQSLDPQKDKLKAYGCEKFYSDIISGAKFNREGLSEMFKVLRKGDVLVVYKLDRLGRSTKELIEIVENLKTKGVEFVSLTEKVDTTTPAGKLFFGMIAVFAEFEKDLISERTKAGLASANARGRFGGRPVVATPEKIRMAKALHSDKQNKVVDNIKALGISRALYFQMIKEKQNKVDDIKILDVHFQMVKEKQLAM